jgi:hypothetical protein
MQAKLRSRPTSLVDHGSRSATRIVGDREEVRQAMFVLSHRNALPQTIDALGMTSLSSVNGRSRRPFGSVKVVQWRCRVEGGTLRLSGRVGLPDDEVVAGEATADAAVPGPGSWTPNRGRGRPRSLAGSASASMTTPPFVPKSVANQVQWIPSSSTARSVRGTRGSVPRRPPSPAPAPRNHSPYPGIGAIFSRKTHPPFITGSLPGSMLVP